MNVYELAAAIAITALGAFGYGASGYGFNLLVVPLLALVDPRLVPGPLLAAGLPLGILMARHERNCSTPGGSDGRCSAGCPGA